MKVEFVFLKKNLEKRGVKILKIFFFSVSVFITIKHSSYFMTKMVVIRNFKF